MDNELFKIRVKQSGLTQVKLAEKAGISRTTIQNIMSGKHSPSCVVSKLLSNALGLTEKEFLMVFYADHEFSKDEGPSLT